MVLLLSYFVEESEAEEQVQGHTGRKVKRWGSQLRLQIPCF